MTNALTLKEAAKRVAFAAMKPAQVKDYHSNRFAQVVVDQGYVTVATNGHRLAYCKFGDAPTTDQRFRVDPKTGVTNPEEQLATHEFCDWKRVLPKTREAISFDRKALLAALSAIEEGTKILKDARKEAAKNAATKAAATLNSASKAKANEALKSAKERAAEDIHAAATFDADGVHFQLDIRTEDEAEFQIKRFVPAAEVPLKVAELHLGFNIKYFREAVRATKGESVVWELSKEEPAHRAFQIAAKDDNLTNVVMPVRFRHLELDPPAEAEKPAPAPEKPAKKSSKKSTPPGWVSATTEPKTTTAKPSKRTAKPVPAPAPEPTPAPAPEPVQTAEANELVKVQMRRGQRHWRTQETFKNISDAEKFFRSVQPRKNQSWRVFHNGQAVNS